MTVPDAPPNPEPDDKDWTWVLTRPCPDCGYDAASITFDQVGAGTRAAVTVLRQALDRPAATVRPTPSVWSPLEYACHVRDVCRLFTIRLTLMLEQDDPLFANWDQDETARLDRYWEQSPATVSNELQAAAEEIGAAIDAVRADQLARPGRRSNGSRFTVDTLCRYFEHDVVHHAYDVNAQPVAE